MSCTLSYYEPPLNFFFALQFCKQDSPSSDQNVFAAIAFEEEKILHLPFIRFFTGQSEQVKAIVFIILLSLIEKYGRIFLFQTTDFSLISAQTILQCKLSCEYFDIPHRQTSIEFFSFPPNPSG